MTTIHSTPANAYYEGPEIADLIFDALKAAGLDTSALQIDDLAALDEFHAQGRAATLALADLAAIRPGEMVLDAGAGIGGPSRVLASRFGASVTAVDGTARFCRANERLCEATGLADAVTVQLADLLALPNPDATFDVAWLQALTQNVPDKPALFSELRRVLRPGGRLALFEVCAAGGGPLHFPVPWADEQSQSFLVSSPDLRKTVEAAGFQTVTWRTRADTLAAIGAAAEQLAAPAAPEGVGLHLLMPAFEQRMSTLLRNVMEDRVELVMALLRAV